MLVEISFLFSGFIVHTSQWHLYFHCYWADKRLMKHQWCLILLKLTCAEFFRMPFKYEILVIRSYFVFSWAHVWILSWTNLLFSLCLANHNKALCINIAEIRSMMNLCRKNMWFKKFPIYHYPIISFSGNSHSYMLSCHSLTKLCCK